MKIQYALMSSKADQYVEYWPTVAAAWLRLGITPVCLFIPTHPSVQLPAVPGSIVHTIPPLPDVHIAHQLSMLPFWASHLYPNATVTVSDLDFIPLSKHFFTLSPWPDHAYVYLSPLRGDPLLFNVYGPDRRIIKHKNMKYLNAWFHVAKGGVMHRVLKLSSNWETACKRTLLYTLHREAKITTDLYSWQQIRREGNEKGDIPWFGSDIYPSVRLHYSKYRPIHYLTYQAVGQRMVEWRSILPAIAAFYHASKKEDYIGIHFASTSYTQVKEIIAHLLNTGTLPKPKNLWFVLLLKRLIDLARYSKNKKPGPYLSMFLLTMVWFILRLLRWIPISSTFNLVYSKPLLMTLGYTRDDWLASNLQMMRLYHLRIKMGGGGGGSQETMIIGIIFPAEQQEEYDIGDTGSP